MKILLFAGARDAIGASEISLEIEAPVTARELLDRVCASNAALAPYAPSIRVAVNGAYARWEELVSPGDEVALIPPVAGG